MTCHSERTRRISLPPQKILHSVQDNSIKREPSSGFTLIEILVVIVIVGIMAGAIVISIPKMGNRVGVREMDRLALVIDTARQMAVQENRSYALRSETSRYIVEAYDASTCQWVETTASPLFRPYPLPDGWQLTLQPEQAAAATVSLPESVPSNSIILLSNEEATPARLVLRHDAGGLTLSATVSAEGVLEQDKDKAKEP